MFRKMVFGVTPPHIWPLRPSAEIFFAASLYSVCHTINDPLPYMTPRSPENRLLGHTLVGDSGKHLTLKATLKILGS